MNIDLEKLAKIIAKKNLYLTFDFNDSPAELYGGNWERVDENLTLWTTTTQGEAGNIIAAGLPNINGFASGIRTYYGLKEHMENNVGGAFSWENAISSEIQAGTGYGAASGNLKIDASLSNSIYGNSSTVQPPAIKVYLWRKV